MTGVSTIIAPSGTVIESTELLTEDYAMAGVAVRTDRTLYSYIGNLFVYLSFGAFALPFLYEGVRLVKEKAKRTSDTKKEETE